MATSPIKRGPEVRVTSQAALMLLDKNNRPVYYSPEAVAIMNFPQRGKNAGDIPTQLPSELELLLGRSGSFAGVLPMVQFVSGKRSYLCRAFVLNHSSGTPARGMIGILIERNAPKSPHVSALAEQFRLTQREQETVRFLTLGLTSKEIAARMRISPNTVKTFFRQVMTKMGVNTRSGIVGKMATL